MEKLPCKVGPHFKSPLCVLLLVYWEHNNVFKGFVTLQDSGRHKPISKEQIYNLQYGADHLKTPLDAAPADSIMLFFSSLLYTVYWADMAHS